MNRLLRPILPLPSALSRRQPPAAVSSPLTRAVTSDAAAVPDGGDSAPPPPPAKMTDPGSHRDIRRSFYIDAVVDKVMNKSLGHPFLMWTKTRAQWYRNLKSERGCRLLLKSKFLLQLRNSIRDDDLDTMKRFGAEKVCLGRSFDEHIRIKRELFHYKYLSLADAARSAADIGRRTASRGQPENLEDQTTMREAVYDVVVEDSGAGEDLKLEDERKESSEI